MHIKITINEAKRSGIGVNEIPAVQTDVFIYSEESQRERR